MKSNLKRSIVAAIIFGLFILFVSRNFGVIQDTYSTTTSHLTAFLFLALGTMAICYFFITRMYLGTFGLAGLKRSFKEMLALTLQALAINLIVPTAGVSMAVLFSDNARDHDESQAAAINGVFLTFMVDYTAISFLLLLALIFLSAINSLTPQVYIPAIIFFLLTIGIYLLSFLARTARPFLNTIFGLLCRFIIVPILKLFKKKTKVEEHIGSFIDELKEVNKYIVKNPGRLAEIVLLALAAHFMRLLTLYVVFISLGLEPLYRVVLAGYAIGALFVVVSPTPNGVGFVETSMALVFSSLGIPLPVATTATIIYRAFEFWIPFGIGFFLLQRNRIKKISEETFS